MFVAPGEAEAMCAALDAAGYADGCATADADALLFGARAVFCTLRLSVRARCLTGASVPCKRSWGSLVHCAAFCTLCLSVRAPQRGELGRHATPCWGCNQASDIICFALMCSRLLD